MCVVAQILEAVAMEPASSSEPVGRRAAKHLQDPVVQALPSKASEEHR